MSRALTPDDAAGERPLRIKRTRPNETIQPKETSRPVLSHLQKKRGLKKKNEATTRGGGQLTTAQR